MTINSIGTPRMKPVVDFDWTPKGSSITYVAGGDTYPPTPLHVGDTRYLAYYTPVTTQITFTASVTTALDAFVTEYAWNFGDNTTGFGQQVTHTFEAANPSLEVTLVVIDNWAQRSSASHALNLLYLNVVAAAPIVRV